MSRSIDIDVGQNKKYASKQQYGGSEYTSGENIKALIMLCVHTYYEGVFDDFIYFFDFFSHVTLCSGQRIMKFQKTP